MAIVTEIGETGPRSRQVAVALDGEPWTTLPRRWAARLRLEPGRMIGDEERAQIEARLADEVGRFLCLSALDRSGRSERELRLRLERYGLAPACIERALESVSSLLDDDALAVGVVRSLQLRGYGPARIARALRLRGLPPPAEPDPDAGEAELERALAALGRRHPDDPRKAAAFLARRGFGPQMSWAAVRARRSPA